MKPASAAALLAVAAAVAVAALAAETASTTEGHAAMERVTERVATSTELLGAEGENTTSSAPASSEAAVPAATAQPRRLLLNKCCKRNEELDKYQKLCVASGRLKNPEYETWGTVRSRAQPGWLNKVIWTTLKNASTTTIVRYNRRPCPFNLTALKWSKETTIFSNGSLQVELNLSYTHTSRQGMPLEVAEVKLWPNAQKQTMLLSPEEYCVDKTAVNKGYMVLLTCPCSRVPCVRKCCDYSQKLTLGESVAMKQGVHCLAKTNVTFNVTLRSGRDAQSNVSYSMLRGPFDPGDCAAGRLSIALDASDTKMADVVLWANGSMSAKVLGSPFLPDEYCVDRTVSPYGEERMWALVCAKVPPPKPMTALDMVYVALYVVGIASLVATLVVYALLAELRRPVNAKALMCHAAALVVALLVMCVSRFVKQVQTYAQCASLAFVAQYSLLAAFCWLSVLCFDISRAFSTSLRPVDSSEGAACRRLLYYCLFAWGGPAVIVSVSAYLNFAKGLSQSILRPDIGRQGCWFRKGTTVLAYYYGPVAFLLLANVVMFSFTMVRLRMAQQETAKLKNDEGQLTGGALRRRRERLLLYAKLFSLMGVTWTLEVVAWAAGADKAIVLIIDSVNVLRGVGVFVACCCKRHVLRSLRARLAEVLPCAPRPAMRERGLSYTVTTTLSVSTPEAQRVRRLASLQ